VVAAHQGVAGVDGAPVSAVKERLTQVEALAAYAQVKAFMARNPVGCCVHIVLDDGNVDDDSVAFCVGYARENEHPECVAMAETLLRMSRTQRRKAGYRWS
jgi:hypothetical protein